MPKLTSIIIVLKKSNTQAHSLSSELEPLEENIFVIFRPEKTTH
jgi:hypothetical protein